MEAFQMKPQMKLSFFEIQFSIKKNKCVFPVGGCVFQVYVTAMSALHARLAAGRAPDGAAAWLRLIERRRRSRSAD